MEKEQFDREYSMAKEQLRIDTEKYQAEKLKRQQKEKIWSVVFGILLFAIGIWMYVRQQELDYIATCNHQGIYHNVVLNTLNHATLGAVGSQQNVTDCR